MSVFEINNKIENALNGPIDKYVIYLRKSRADEDAEKYGDGDTLARHRKILTELAVRKGLYVEKIYEEVVSGETIEARPEIQKMIQECYEGKYRGIIIIEVTRLSRGNSGDAQVIMDCLKYSNRNNGLLVVTPTKTYDVAHSHDDEEYMEFELFMSRREYKMIQKRMDRGKKQAIVEGNFMATHRPYGYEIVTDRKTRTLVPNPDEAKIVQQIFDWVVNDGLTAWKIAQKLTNMGVPTYTGKSKEWHRDSVRSILMNPIYIGKVRWNNIMYVKTMKDGELVKHRRKMEGTEHYMLYDGKHSPIIDGETFQKASTHYKRDKTKDGYILKNPLAGLFYCKCCGKSMHYESYAHKKGNVKPRYIHPTSQFCKVKSVIVDDVLSAFIYSLKLYIEDFELKIDNKPSVSEDSVKAQIDLMEKEIKVSQRALSKLFDGWEAEAISDNEFVERKHVHNSRIEALKKEIASLESTIPEQEEYREKIMLLSDALDAIQDPDIDAETKNQFLKKIISKVDFSRENPDEFILEVFLT